MSDWHWGDVIHKLGECDKRDTILDCFLVFRKWAGSWESALVRVEPSSGAKSLALEGEVHPAGARFFDLKDADAMSRMGSYD